MSDKTAPEFQKDLSEIPPVMQQPQHATAPPPYFPNQEYPPVAGGAHPHSQQPYWSPEQNHQQWSHTNPQQWSHTTPQQQGPGSPNQEPPYNLNQIGGSQSVQVVQINQGGANLSPSWQTDVLDCCANCPICCTGFFCTLCMACADAKRVGHSCCHGMCCLCRVRTHVRMKYGIEGSECNDCCCCWFCYSCTACQIARELQSREGPGSICC